MINTLGRDEDTSWHRQAAMALRHELKERGELANLRVAVRNAEFWRYMHFNTGMDIRNTLRDLGYGEKDFPIWNLDDHYVPIMLLAVGYAIDGGYNAFMDPVEIVQNLLPANACY